MNFLQGRTMLMTWIWYSEGIRFNWIDAYQALAYVRYCVNHQNTVVKKKKSQFLRMLYFSEVKYGLIEIKNYKFMQSNYITNIPFYMYMIMCLYTSMLLSVM